MKRLKLHQKSDKLLTTSEHLCSKDVLIGEVHLLSDQIQWGVLGSDNNIIEAGISNTVEQARKQIKRVLSDNGAKFETEKRKFKI